MFIRELTTQNLQNPDEPEQPQGHLQKRKNKKRET